MSFKSGYGSSDLSASLSNGMITQVGQKTDTKVPETITAVSDLAKSIGPLMTAAAMTAKNGQGQQNPPPPKQCKPEAKLYAVTNGSVASSPSVDFKVTPTN